MHKHRNAERGTDSLYPLKLDRYSQVAVKKKEKKCRLLDLMVHKSLTRTLLLVAIQARTKDRY